MYLYSYMYYCSQLLRRHSLLNYAVEQLIARGNQCFPHGYDVAISQCSFRHYCHLNVSSKMADIDILLFSPRVAKRRADRRRRVSLLLAALEIVIINV